MGIKHFFAWIRQNFTQEVIGFQRGKTVPQVMNQDIDVLMFDLNTIFHNCCAKVYEYGPHKRPEHLLTNAPQLSPKTLQLNAFKAIANNIDRIIEIVKPKQRVLLCIDGVAPMGKQNQQRSRRFRSAKDKTEEEFKKFDSNQITPGTEFLDFLSKYLDYYIRTKVGNTWKFEVLFSNEKVPGEGEHKIINYVRGLNNEQKELRYMVYGVDADLIMLTLGTMLPDVHILRENMIGYDHFHIVKISEIRNKLIDMMFWQEESEHIFDPEIVIYDFICMCFTVGNDFLPQIPTIEIYEGGIEIMMNIYKSVCSVHGHLTEKSREKGVVFRPVVMGKFFETLAELEKEILEKKKNKPESGNPDPIVDISSKLNSESVYTVDIEKFEIIYNRDRLEKEEKKACLLYLEGMNWVLGYYIQGCTNWTYTYNYHYAPMMRTLARYIQDYHTKPLVVNKPSSPFMQLLRVLPIKSHNLLPDPLPQAITGNIKKYYPEEFVVDMAGKKQDWEGVALVPFVNDKELYSEYQKLVTKVNDKDSRRNRVGWCYLYTPEGKFQNFSCYYGNIVQKCSVKSFSDF